jgi:hypothetical protein
MAWFARMLDKVRLNAQGELRLIMFLGLAKDTMAGAAGS